MMDSGTVGVDGAPSFKLDLHNDHDVNTKGKGSQGPAEDLVELEDGPSSSSSSTSSSLAQPPLILRFIRIPLYF